MTYRPLDDINVEKKRVIKYMITMIARKNDQVADLWKGEVQSNLFIYDLDYEKCNDAV